MINTLDRESGLSEVVLTAKLIILYIDQKIDSRNFSLRYRKGHKGQIFCYSVLSYFFTKTGDVCLQFKITNNYRSCICGSDGVGAGSKNCTLGILM